MAKRAQQGSGEELCYSQIATYDEFDREDAFGRVFIKPLIVKNLFSAEMRIPQGTERRFTMDRGKPEKLNHKKRQIPKISSWAVTQQNLLTKSKTKCETDRKECRTLQSQVKSIQ